MAAMLIGVSCLTISASYIIHTNTLLVIIWAVDKSSLTDTLVTTKSVATQGIHVACSQYWNTFIEIWKRKKKSYIIQNVLFLVLPQLSPIPSPSLPSYSLSSHSLLSHCLASHYLPFPSRLSHFLPSHSLPS